MTATHPTDAAALVGTPICIAVDDLGLHAGIHPAALRLVAMGRVHALGCQVGGAAWPAASAALRQLPAGQAELGLHLDLTERPLQPRLARPLGALIRACYTGRVDRPALRAEIQAQLDRFEHTLGRPPDYVDGHQHVHQLPVVRDALLAELQARQARDPNRRPPWLRSTQTAPAPGTPRFKPWVIQTLGAAALARQTQALGWRQNRRLLGVYGFDGGPVRYQALLAAWLAAATPGDLLMCHAGLAPSVADAADAVDALGAPDPLALARQVEFDCLASDAFGAALRAAGVRLQAMGPLLAAGAAAA